MSLQSTDAACRRQTLPATRAAANRGRPLVALAAGAQPSSLVGVATGWHPGDGPVPSMIAATDKTLRRDRGRLTTAGGRRATCLTTS